MPVSYSDGIRYIMSGSGVNSHSDKNGALSGYRVLDLTDGKGEFCSCLLANMGAQIIKVRNPEADLTGNIAPFPSKTTNVSNFFGEKNIDKLHITLDINTKVGREIFKRLVEVTDVVVESNPAGYLAELGLDYRKIREINHRLVMASITNFGQSGPYQYYKSCDLVASALGGSMYVSGEHYMPPLKPFGNQAYCSAGLFAAIGVLLALWKRRTTHMGQHIDISVTECVAATLDHVLVRYFYQGVVAKRQGSLSWNNAFRIFPCSDGYIVLSLFQQWSTLVELLDADGMAEDLIDTKWLGNQERVVNLEHIIEVLTRWTQGHTVAELVKKGQSMRFPWAEVAAVSRLANNPQLRKRNFFAEVEHRQYGKNYRRSEVPYKLNWTPR